MTVRTLRAAIIGTGMISHRHMTVYRHINEQAESLGFQVEIAAVAELDKERLDAWAKQYGIDEKDCYLDYHDMLKRTDIDWVDVCVYTNYHTPIAIEVMKAGFDCYCEKPEAASYRDAKLMVDASKKLGRKLHVQMSSLMTAQTRMAKSYVQSGKIGNPYMMNLEVCLQRRRPGCDLEEFPQQFMSTKLAGHGQSVDLGVYLIGQMLHIFDCPKVQSVMGFAGQFIGYDKSKVKVPGGFDVDDTMDGMVRFENGLNFHYTNMSANNMKNHVMTYILGTKGSLELLATDMAGGKFARQNITDGPGFMGEPDIIYHQEVNGEVTEEKLNCDEQGMAALEKDPMLKYYNDNQCMWIAYKLGILDDNTRYNTPEIALNQLLITDGMFLSSKLGRSVTYDEIIENSPSLFPREQEINGKMYKFDVEF